MHAKNRGVRGGPGRKVQTTLYAREVCVVAGFTERVVELDCPHFVDGRCKFAETAH